MLGGANATWDDVIAASKPELDRLKGGWIVGGYLSELGGAESRRSTGSGFKVSAGYSPQRTGLGAADVVLPAAAWAEKDGCWENLPGQDPSPFHGRDPSAGWRGARGRCVLQAAQSPRGASYNAEIKSARKWASRSRPLKLPAEEAKLRRQPQFVEL